MSLDPLVILRRHFGYAGFRPGQEELVRAVLDGRDALGVLPTGGGKSVCYQVPALALGGLTLVVTPLISLMEDQVRRALEAGLRAAHLSSGQEAGARRRLLSRAVEGDLDVLFVAPERLRLASFRSALARADVRLLAVDEAHCISEWGHDFRPAYRGIGRARSVLEAPVLALTATATPRVRADVIGSLCLRDPVNVVRSFDRPNLSWSVLRGGPKAERVGRIHRLLRRIGGTAVVYAPTRRSVEDARDALAGYGVRALAYHAGLPPAERSRVQEAFMGGVCRVVVATNAFGMGVDKSDVRLVAHVQLPGTLEAYYQEAGRAGRDGAPAWCVAFHDPGDRALAQAFVDRSHPPRRCLSRLHRGLLGSADADGVASLRLHAVARLLGPGATPEDAAGAVAALARTGAVRVLPGQDGTLEGTGDPAEGFLCIRIGVRARPHLAPASRLRHVALAKLEAVQRFARGRGCRRRALLAYFGEVAPTRCGGCDRCLRRSAPQLLEHYRHPWTDI